MPSMKVASEWTGIAMVGGGGCSSSATFIVGNGWATDLLLVLLASTAATIGGYSRVMIAATMHSVLFLAITINLAHATPNPARPLFPVILGGLWASILSVVLGACLRAHKSIDQSYDAATTSTATATQKFKRWKRSLASLSGWAIHNKNYAVSEHCQWTVMLMT